ncbi:MAG: protein kinase [Myxococcales bacterium]|nr:protein kinase [Myxococcales bacterium]
MEIGQLVAGRFELVSVAGRGGMGTVYRARDRACDGWVALKIVPLEGHGAFVRFAREAEALAATDDPAVVAYVGHGRLSPEVAWLALEWLEGSDLADRLERQRLSVEETIAVGRRIAQALAVLHRAGIVHRDVKPSNVWLVDGDAGQAKLLDFGLARHEVTHRYATAAGMALGTPGYMAPEQIGDASDVSPRMDVFGLGALLYACLAGVGPFDAAHAMAALARVALESPRPLGELRDDVPAGLLELVDAMLDKDPERRPADGDAVWARLSQPSVLRSRPPIPQAISHQERLTTTLVLARYASSPEAGVGALADTALAHGSEWLAGASEVARIYEMQAHPLGDQGVLFVPRERGYAADLAARSCDFAEELRAIAPPDLRLAVTTGRATAGGQLPFGALVASAVRQMAEHPDEGVVVADATHALLAGRSPARPELFGRRVELAALRASWESCCEDEVPHGVLVTGPPGIGKSRLVAEAVADATAGGATHWSARAQRHRRHSPYLVIAALLAKAAGSAEQVAAWLREGLDPGAAALLASLMVPLLSSRPGHELTETPDVVAARRDPRLYRERVEEAWLELLERQVERGALVIEVDHAQWVDPPSWALLSQTLAMKCGALWVLALGRESAADRLPAMWQERATRIGLTALNDRAMTRLGLGLGLDAEKVAPLVALAEGNPLHLEELAKAERSGATAAPPDGLLALLEARLGQLDDEPRRTLRAASVLTAPFEAPPLAALLGEPTAALVATLKILEEAAFLLRDGDGWAFRQELLREAAHATIPAEERSAAHLAAARWLEASGNPDPFVLARHFEEGGAPTRAATALRSAALRSFEAGDAISTLALLERARELDATDDPELELLEARALRFRGDAAAFDRIGALVERLPRNGVAWFTAAAEQAAALAARGAVEALAALGRDLRDALPNVADADRGRCAGFAAVVIHSLVGAGLHELADELGAPVEAVLAAHPLEAGSWGFLHIARSHRAISVGEVATCRDEAERAVEAFGLAKNRRSQCTARVVLGYALSELGHLDEAAAVLTDALTTAERGGLGMLAQSARQNLGRTRERQGRFDEAIPLLEEAAEAFAGDARMLGCTQIYLATARWRKGEPDLATRAARAALETLGSDAPFSAFAEATLARILLPSQPDEAFALARSAYEALRQRGRLEDGEATVRLAWAEACQAKAPDHAAAAIEDAVTRLLERADAIPSPNDRAAFLTALRDHAETLALAATTPQT